jgi:ferredoxin-NADP reductase
MDTDPADAAIPPVGPWQQATVTDIRTETPNAKTFALELSHPTRHLAGQHFVVRLTAPDGYIAQRSYSVASAPGDGTSIELTVERLPDGEVSTFLHDELRVGDGLDVRGPVGGWFVWEGTRPALLVGGGSGVVPLMAMLRLARSRRVSDLVRLVVSVRAPSDLYYADELAGPESSVVYTRTTPPGLARPAGRITASDLPSTMLESATVYVCGSPAFCDFVTDLALEGGAARERIRVERFGPSG